jgi:hypothetical protein
VTICDVVDASTQLLLVALDTLAWVGSFAARFAPPPPHAASIAIENTATERRSVTTRVGIGWLNMWTS